MWVEVCCDTDVDECSVNNGYCSPHAYCTNTPGSHNCTCVEGYDGDGFNCLGQSSQQHYHVLLVVVCLANFAPQMTYFVCRFIWHSAFLTKKCRYNWERNAAIDSLVYMYVLNCSMKYNCRAHFTIIIFSKNVSRGALWYRCWWVCCE